VEGMTIFASQASAQAAHARRLAVAIGGLVLVVKVVLLKALFEGIYLPVVVVY